MVMETCDSRTSEHGSGCPGVMKHSWVVSTGILESEFARLPGRERDALAEMTSVWQEKGEGGLVFWYDGPGWKSRLKVGPCPRT